MFRLPLITGLLWMSATAVAQQHPLSFITAAEAASVKAGIAKYPLLNQFYSEIKGRVDGWIGKDVDVPFPKDPVGGYTHDKHKSNYLLMFNSGLLYNTLSAVEKKTIEQGAFKPEVDYFPKELKDWFNLLHNHAVWACAGVGMIGIASHNKNHVDITLNGTQKDGKAGFIAQMDNLFSPDGYYTEGPCRVWYDGKQLK